MNAKKKMYLIATITAMLCVALIISGFLLVGDSGASQPEVLTATPTTVPEILATETPAAESEPTEASFETPVPIPTQTAFETPVTIPTVTSQPVRTQVRPTLTPVSYVPTAVVLPSATPSPRPSIPVITEWRGEYYGNTDLSGAPWLVRNDMQIDFNWGPYAPAAGLPADGFSARWIRTLAFEQGYYRFHAYVDDGVRVYVDGKLILNEWREGSAREMTVDGAVSAGYHTMQIEYLERYGEARIVVWWERIAANTPTPTITDWKGEYWGNRQLAGNPVLVRNDRAIDFDLGLGSFAANLPADNLSARWSRTLNWNGEYRFFARADDGIRVYVDGRRVLDYWNNNDGRGTYSIDLTLNGQHQVVVEYYENVGNALIKFWWEKKVATPTATATRRSTGTPTATATRRATKTPTATATRANRTPTVTRTSTPVPPRSVRLNEVLPVPGGKDWNNDRVADERDEWIELYNAGAQAIDLSGWMLDDGKNGSQPYRIPAGTIIRPHAYLVLYRSVTGINLNDMGDQVRLFNKNAQLVDSVAFGKIKPGLSYSRDLSGHWHADTLPSPGKPNPF